MLTPQNSGWVTYRTHQTCVLLQKNMFSPLLHVYSIKLENQMFNFNSYFTCTLTTLRRNDHEQIA